MADLCTKCGKEKTNAEYGESWCKACKKVYKKAYTRTKKGLLNRIYSAQKSSSKDRGHRPPEYSKQELSDWLFSQTLFHELYDEWVRSDYEKRLKPSVDRKHDDIHYCMSNIQLMTWGENDDKGRSKTVYQYKYNKLMGIGSFIASYSSVVEASRVSGVNAPNIGSGATGKTKSAGGYFWSYKKLDIQN